MIKKIIKQQPIAWAVALFFFVVQLSAFFIVTANGSWKSTVIQIIHTVAYIMFMYMNYRASVLHIEVDEILKGIDDTKAEWLKRRDDLHVLDLVIDACRRKYGLAKDNTTAIDRVIKELASIGLEQHRQKEVKDFFATFDEELPE
jgi:hypothetical protein